MTIAILLTKEYPGEHLIDGQTIIDMVAKINELVTANNGVISNVSTGTYTLGSGDAGKTLVFAAAATVTVPSTLPVGMEVALVQSGASQVTVMAGAGTTLENRLSFTATAGQFGAIVVTIIASGIALLTGDGA